MKHASVRYCLAFMLSSLATVSAETPNQAAAAIHGLLVEKNYQTLFPTLYTEWYKVEQEGIPVDMALKKMSARFEKQHDFLLTVYEQLKTAEFTMGTNDHPQRGENGRMAEATIELNGREVPFKLYQMTSEKWGFHQ